MTSQNRQQQVPEWFNGQVYEEGETVTNPFSGATYYLNALELSIYDFIIGSNMVVESKPELLKLLGVTKETLYDSINLGCDWFKRNNAEAYMILLD